MQLPQTTIRYSDRLLLKHLGQKQLVFANSEFLETINYLAERHGINPARFLVDGDRKNLQSLLCRCLAGLPRPDRKRNIIDIERDIAMVLDPQPQENMRSIDVYTFQQKSETQQEQGNRIVQRLQTISDRQEQIREDLGVRFRRLTTKWQK